MIMKELRYTLAADGPTDTALLPILNWLLKQHGWYNPNQPGFICARQVPPGKSKDGLTPLARRIQFALDQFPCDIIFVHRDAENDKNPLVKRRAEIEGAMIQLLEICYVKVTIPVIPIRMTEAWLLIEEKAIRAAVGNPNGKMKLDMPQSKLIESIPDPKEKLNFLFREASGISSRRYREPGTNRLAFLIEDFIPLRSLSAFKELEEEVISSLDVLKQNK